VVVHRARKYGTSKFGWERFINGFLDLLSIQFVSRFGKKPMHFFGLLGTLTFLLGFGVILTLVIARIREGASFGLTHKVGFYLAPPIMVVGTLFFLTGFVAELVVRNASDRNLYLTEEKIGL
jgi:hypothetical protein